DDADGAHRAEGPGVGEVAGEEREQAEGHGGGAGGDRAEGAAHRDEGGRRPVLAQGEFLPEAGGQEQRVVGGRADHEDGEDALHLPVDHDDVPVGQEVDDRAGQGQGEHRAEDDHERQEDAAVDEQQDEQDRAQGHAQQQSVDAGEGGGQIGLAGGPSSDLGPGAGYVAHRLTHVVQDAGQFVAQVGLQLDHGLQGQSVVGGEGG